MVKINPDYSRIIKENPLLTKKQEFELSKKSKNGDLKARKKLIESNYRLVISIAKKYHRSDLDFEDLFQESSIGLLKAESRFDPDLGYKFSTYACWWIKQAALQYINEKTSNIKVPTHSRLLNSKIKKSIKDFEDINGHSPSLEEISDIVNEPVKKIKYTIRSNKNISSIDQQKDDNTNSSIINKIEDSSTFSNPEKALENKELNNIIEESLSLLSPKEEKIIRLRFGINNNDNNFNKFPVTEEMKKYLEK
jgi:RNA polymerase primary sigma factor